MLISLCREQLEAMKRELDAATVAAEDFAAQLRVLTDRYAAIGD